MKLSVQLFTLRQPMEVDPLGTLRALASMGFRYVELAGYYGHSAEQMKIWLDDAGLKVSGSHVGLDQLKAGLHSVIEESRTLGNRFVILPWIASEHYADGWELVGKWLTEIGRRLADDGLEFAYHNHSFELSRDERGQVALDVLWESSDPELLKAQIDTAWIYHGGLDPAAYITKLAGRVPLVHLKDFTSDGKDAVAGEGALSWNEILSACQEVSVEFGAIEMDTPPTDPLADVERCLEFFKSHGLN